MRISRGRVAICGACIFALTVTIGVGPPATTEGNAPAATTTATAPTTAPAEALSAERIEWESTVAFRNSVGIRMVEVGRTQSWIGAPPGAGEGDERLREVTVEPFYLGATEVTREQWRALYGAQADPSQYPEEDANGGGKAADMSLPVNNVTWAEAVQFCLDLSTREGKHYRLPSEIEWEVASWAGRRSGPGGAALPADTLRDIDPAHYAKEHLAYLTYQDRSLPAGKAYDAYVRRGPSRTLATKPAVVNGREVPVLDYQHAIPPGFFGMRGNVWEWTSTRTVPTTLPTNEGGRPVTPADVENPQVLANTISACLWADGDDVVAIRGFDDQMREKGRFVFFVVRGGAYDRPLMSCTHFNRFAQLAYESAPQPKRNVGFRVALDP